MIKVFDMVEGSELWRNAAWYNTETGEVTFEPKTKIVPIHIDRVVVATINFNSRASALKMWEDMGLKAQRMVRYLAPYWTGSWLSLIEDVQILDMSSFYYGMGYDGLYFHSLISNSSNYEGLVNMLNNFFDLNLTMSEMEYIAGIHDHLPGSFSDWLASARAMEA